MGRRKIEIKPIRDDRNRSVTFLKRKGGLFKKAHELSVLCQVDVAVVIFGHNKKLYEYSSNDINEILGRFQYYGGAHEHKGPQDFADKGGGDDDDDDDDGGDEGDQRGTPQPEPHMTGIQHHPAFQHVRHGTPQHSPPMHNGPMPPYQRGPSPLPQNLSRPSSRADQQQQQGHVRRVSSNLVAPPHPQQPPVPQQSYAYTPNPPFYNPQAAAQMQRPPPPASTYPPPYQPPAQHPQMQQVMMQDNRRSSLPPAFPPQPPPQANMQRNVSQDHLRTPPQPQAHTSPRPQHQQPQRPTPSPQPPQQQFASPPMPQPRPLPAHAKSQSMFTPIDDSRSMLAQHWGSTSNTETPRSDAASKSESGGPRSASIDIAAMQREKEAIANNTNGVQSPSRRPPRSPQPPLRTASTPTTTGPPRSNPIQAAAEPKRPRLKVQIPSEQSGDEGGTASAPDDPSTSQSRDNTAGGGGSETTNKQQQQPPSHGVVLPPPSPSAGALLSAGAQGPPNPFARPAPPMSTNPHAMNRDAAGTSNSNSNNSSSNNHIETPISALPSRFMSDNLLPSPSTFYPEWGFGRGGTGGPDSASNMLPSPLNFQTPVQGNGVGWRGEEERDRERERKRERGGSEDDDGGGGGGGGPSEAKKVKT